MSIVEFDVPHYNPTTPTHGPTIDIYDLTEKQGTVNSITKQMKVVLWNVRTIYNPRKVFTWLPEG